MPKQCAPMKSRPASPILQSFPKHQWCKEKVKRAVDSEQVLEVPFVEIVSDEEENLIRETGEIFEHHGSWFLLRYS